MNFASSRLDSSDLFLVKQADREDLRAYVKRFSLVLPPMDPAINKIAMLQGT